MYANYHTHTYLCHHAKDTPKEYVEHAIKNGLKILGFSDHAPYFFDADYTSNPRMDIADIPTYLAEIKALQQQYKNQIQIYIGYEMEYYPKTFDKTVQHLQQYGYDYLILGQHFIQNEHDGACIFVPHDETVLCQYVKQCCAAMQTGLFSYIAHPDVPCYNGSQEVYQQQMTLLCQTAKQCDVPLECNLLGVRDGRHYPNPEFWEIAAEVGNAVILGCDSHSSRSVGNPENVQNGIDFLKTFGITPIETLTFK